jgi:hypothetical protein
MKTCALMVPREHKVEHRNPLTSLTDEELDQPSRSSSKCWRGGPARAPFTVGESPKRKPSDDPDAARYLEKNLLETPSLALADASRETPRIGDVVELMLRQITRCAQFVRDATHCVENLFRLAMPLSFSPVGLLVEPQWRRQGTRAVKRNWRA